MRDVTPAEQEYLETLLHLFEAGRPLTAANVSREMSLSAPTVHEMVKRLVADGLVERDERKRISFTDEGLEIARHAASRHRLVERFLTDVLGIPWYEVHGEAEKIDQAMSDAVAERMREAIGTATTCPHGHPIAAGNRVQCGTRLAEVPVGGRITVLRFENEHDDALRDLHAAGLKLGFAATVERFEDDAVVLRTDDDAEARVDLDVANTIAVWSTAAMPTTGPAAMKDTSAA